ncbi:MAG: spore coat protein U domain-containing protein [Deltaproteobacteria bacterium]|nr:spore coat protein U domain-containing protein [Deltaproteobacteria bacterium]
MKRLLFWVAVATLVLSGASGVAMAATATSNMTATATVISTCRITSVTNVAFGSYDPTDTANLDSTGSFTFRCTRGTDYDLYITGARTMNSATWVGDNLNFELYSDSGRTSVYPSASVGITGTAASNAADVRTVYGRVAAGQDVRAASDYTKTVVVTVQF